MLKILNISGDEALLRTRSELFRLAGYEVSDATDFRMVVKALEERDFDLAIIGHSIPDKEKRRLLTAIRTGAPHARVVELYRYTPDLAEADLTFCTSRSEPQELVDFVRAALDHDDSGGATSP